MPPVRTATTIALPSPRTEGASTLEDRLSRRRSVRAFAAARLPIADVGQLLWAAQGVTSADGGRTAPSAGALYPLELYVSAGRVEDLPVAVYKYCPAGHRLALHIAGDHRAKIAEAALEQRFVAAGAAVLVIAAEYARTATKYGSRAKRYVHMEAGHAAQNVYLQAESLGLGTVAVGAFDDEALREALELPANEAPLVLMPIGTPRGRDSR